MAYNAVPSEFVLEEVTSYLTGKSQKYVEEFLSSIEYMFCRYIFPLINSESFRVLYSESKRPCYPVNILIAHEFYQRMTGKSDAEMRRAMVFDPTVQAALHMYKYFDGLHPISKRALEEFRIRVRSYQINTGIDLMKELGEDMAKKEAALIHTDTSMARIDTGFVDSHSEELSRFKLIYRCVARLVYALQMMGIFVDESLCHYLDSNDWNAISYHDDKTPLDEKIHQVIDDAVLLLRVFRDDPEVTLQEDWYLLNRVFQEQIFQEADGSLRLKKDKSEGLHSQTLQNPTDPDATFRKKGSESHIGYVGLIVEHGSGPTAIRSYWNYGANICADPVFLEEYLHHLPDRPSSDHPTILVGDGLFSSMEAKKLAAEKDIRIVTTDLAGKKPDPLMKDFLLSKDEKELLECPGHQKPLDSRFNEKNRQILAHYSKEQCQNCPFRNQCRVTEQKKNNSVRISLSAVHRARDWNGTNLSEDYARWARYRNGVECNFSLLRNFYRIDEMPVRTFMATNYWFDTVMCGINAKQVCKYFQKLYKQEVKNTRGR